MSTRNPAATGRWVIRLAHLAKTLVDARPVLRDQADDWAEGFSAGNGGGTGRSSGAVADPVGNRVVGPYPSTDRADLGAVQLVEGRGLADSCRETATAIDQWINDGYNLATRCVRLLPLKHPVAEMLAKHAQARFNGAGECAACGDWVEGSDAPGGRKLDSGMCPTDAKQWRRTRDIHHQSAVDWATRERSRRREPADIKTPGARGSNTDGVQLGPTDPGVRPESGAA